VEGKFDKKKLNMKNNCLHYGDKALTDSYHGTDMEERNICLYWKFDGSYEEWEIEWGED
jgi:hypothetical protein